VHDRGLGQGIACDASGCIGKLADGGLVAYAVEPDAFEDDCRRAALIVAVHDDPPPDCAAKVIGRNTWYDHGALTVHRAGSGFVIDSARPQNFDRPWAPNRTPSPPQRDDATTATDATARAPLRSPPRDATPLQDDIEADQ